MVQRCAICARVLASLVIPGPPFVTLVMPLPIGFLTLPMISVNAKMDTLKLMADV